MSNVIQIIHRQDLHLLTQDRFNYAVFLKCLSSLLYQSAEWLLRIPEEQWSGSLHETASEILLGAGYLNRHARELEREEEGGTGGLLAPKDHSGSVSSCVESHAPSAKQSRQWKGCADTHQYLSSLEEQAQDYQSHSTQKWVLLAAVTCQRVQKLINEFEQFSEVEIPASAEASGRWSQELRAALGLTDTRLEERRAVSTEEFGRRATDRYVKFFQLEAVLANRWLIQMGRSLRNCAV